jgi:hypothetical protein
MKYNATVVSSLCQGDLRIIGEEKEVHRAVDGPHGPNSNQHWLAQDRKRAQHHVTGMEQQATANSTVQCTGREQGSGRVWGCPTPESGA